ncbi:MAG: DUF4349 domain-containing protein [Anaerolineales bacterium]|nr:DUF4349 domain-containing protein [Anaerolineales bacterium]
MKRLTPYVLVFIAALILSACGAASATPSPDFYGAAAPQSYDESYAEMPMAAPETMPDSANKGGSGNGNAAQQKRIIIENADIVVVVADVPQRMEAIQNMAKDFGGFVVSANLSQNYSSDGTPLPSANLTVRVPAEKLTDALDFVKKDAVEIRRENRSGTDVTADYVDLQSRLKTYQAAEKELTKLMENAQNADEVVNIFNQLMYYREQIEVIQGQIKYYDEASSLSAINIQLIAEESVKPVTIGKWEPKGVALTAIQDLLDFWKGFVDFTIRFFIYGLPMLITVGIPLYLAFIVLRWLSRKMRGGKKKVEAQNKEEEKK